MMAKLTKYQAEIVTAMREDGVYLWTSEGENYRAWMGGKYGEVIDYVRRTSVTSLYIRDIIAFSDGDYRQGLFRYTLKEAE